MAYIVSTLQTAAASGAATYTVNFPSGVLANDTLVVLLTQDGSTESLGVGTSGFTALGTQAEAGGSAGTSGLPFFKIAAGGETSASFACSTAAVIGTAIVIRDAHATAPFGSVVDGTDYKRGDWNSANNADSPALTSAVDECLLLYAFCCDGTNGYMRCKIDAVIEVDKYVGSASAHIIGCRQQQTAAAAPTVRMYHPTAVEGGNAWVLAVRNKSGGALQPDVRVTGTDLKFYGSWIAQHDSVTWQSLSNFATSVNSIVCSSTAPTVDSTNLWAASPYGFYTILQSTENITAIESPGGSGGWVGGTHTITSVDLTDKVVKIDMASGVVSGSTLAGSEGWLIGFSDGTNWVTYQVKSKAKTWALQDPDSFFVAVGNATVYASSGTVASALSGCTRVGFFFHRISSGTGSSQLHIKNLAYFSRFDITGGGSSRPLTFQDLHTYASSWSHIKLTNLQGASQVKAKVSVQICDGTNGTYFDGATNSICFPQAWSATSNSNWQMDWNVNENKVTLGVYAKSTDTINLSAGTATSGNKQLLTISSSSDTGASYDFSQAFGNFTPTWKTGVECENTIFTGCDTVAFKGASPTNVQVKNTTNATAACSFDTNNKTMTSCTISAAMTPTTNTDYHISLGASITAFTINSTTLSGTPNVDKFYSALASGTLTITTDGLGTSLVAGDVTFVGGSTANAVIAAPAVYQKVIVSGQTAGSRIQIYDTTNSIELFNGTASAGDTVVSGTVATWTDPTAAAGNRAIRVRVAYVNGATAKLWQENTGLTCGTSSTTNSITYPITQVADTTYDSNAVDGSGVTGITFTDAATDLVNINIAADTTPLKDIYAAFVYWLFTAAGIDDDVAYIDAPDPANYIMTSMKFRNTSTDPLKITDGYFYDSTGSVENCVDVAGSSGNIYPMPAHVVPYQTTGTYAITGDLQDALDAIAAVPSDVIAVAVDGSTTLAESLRLANAVLGGKVSGASTGTETFRNLADTKDRVVATVDSSGNRTAITRDLT